MNHIGTKVIETERLILRPFTMADAQAMFDNWASDPVQKHRKTNKTRKTG